VNDSVREFIHRRTSYDEDGIPYDTKKLYAAYRYYMRGKDTYSFNEFRYVISCIPAARLESDYDNNTEVSRIIPEFEYLSRMEEKNKAGLIQMQINNYYKRVTKAIEETKKIYEQLESENGWYPTVVEEEKKEDKVEEIKKDFAEIQHNIKSAFGGEEQRKESSAIIETKKVELKEDDKSLGSVDAAMHDIENNYASVIRKYKALESIKQVIKEEKVKVHDDLKPIFDMLVDNSLKKFEEINPTFPSFEKEVEDLKNNLRNLSNFVKKA
jgi:chromosome segregation ATPase